MFIGINKETGVVIHISNDMINNPDLDVISIDSNDMEIAINKRWNKKTKTLESIEVSSEEKMRLIRLKRDKLLVESDWIFFADSPIDDEKKEEWKVYRQKLRDITSQPNFPEDVVFPDKPTK